VLELCAVWCAVCCAVVLWCAVSYTLCCIESNSMVSTKSGFKIGLNDECTKVSSKSKTKVLR
jgi:hypothetical protein